MITVVGSSPPVVATSAPTAASSSPSATQGASAPTPVKDTVQISDAAKAAKAAMDEATESAAVTAQEANNGDRQAQRLLAKEAAQH